MIPLLKRAITSVRDVSLWGEKEFSFGSVSVLFCDLTLSINLTRKPSSKEIEYLKEKFREFEDIMPQRIPTYGITLEPFQFHLMGSDGDICWCSPGWILIDWLVKNGFSNRYEFQN